MSLVLQNQASATEIGNALDEFRQAAMDFVDLIEVQIACMPPQQPMPVTHRFAGGFYIRQIFIPAGNWLTSKIHNTQHPFVILKGKIYVWTKEHGATFLQAPYLGITEPDTRRVLYAMEDTSWVTFHPTTETDVDKIEENIILKHDNQLIAKLHECLQEA